MNLFNYTNQDPLNRVDPFGLLWYWPPDLEKTVPPTGKTLEALKSLERNLGAEDLFAGKGLLVTGGKEKSGHTKGSLHYENKAIDIAGKVFQSFTDDQVFEAARKAGFTHGMYEDQYEDPAKRHWHLQIGSGLGVPELQNPKPGSTKSYELEARCE